jgi:hypothetical protein
MATLSISGNTLPQTSLKTAWHSFCNCPREASQLEAGCQEPGKWWVWTADCEE